MSSTRLPAIGELEADILERFPEIARVGHAVYTPEGLRAFLFTPLARFDGRTAHDLLEGGEPERVLSALAADYEGLA